MARGDETDMPTKVKELEPHKRDHDPRCSICHPKQKGFIREDQIWGHCPTNALHPAHPTKPGA